MLDAGKAVGPTPFLNSALTATAVLVKAGMVNIFSYDIYNPSNAVAYIQLHDKAAAADVTLGTTVPVAVIPAVTLTRSALADAIALYHFNLGLVIAATTTATGSSAPSAAVIVSMGYSG